MSTYQNEKHEASQASELAQEKTLNTSDTSTLPNADTQECSQNSSSKDEKASCACVENKALKESAHKSKVKIRGLYNSARAVSASKDNKNKRLEEKMKPWQTEDVGTFLGINKRVWAVWFSFMACGLLYSQFTSRLPALTEHLRVDTMSIGLLITAFAGGSLLGLIGSGFILRIVQSKHALRLAILCFMCIMVSIAFIHDYKIALIIFAAWGFSCAFVDVVMNSQAMYLEINTQKNYMGRMHANYSLGCVLGSAIAAAFAFYGFDIDINYICVAFITFLLFIAFSGKLYNDPPSNERKEAVKAYKEDIKEEDKLKTKRTFIPFFVLLCGLMSLFSYTAEGSVAEWGSLVMFSTKGSTEALAALAYGVLALSMAISRFGVDKLRTIFSDAFLIFLGAFIAACCVLVVIFTKDPIICLISYALMGVGLAPISPIAFSRAGSSGLVTPKTAATLVGMIGYGGFLVIPPAIGFLANYVGLERALFLPFVALFIVMLASRAFKLAKKAQAQDKVDSNQAPKEA